MRRLPCIKAVTPVTRRDSEAAALEGDRVTLGRRLFLPLSLQKNANDGPSGLKSAEQHRVLEWVGNT